MQPPNIKISYQYQDLTGFSQKEFIQKLDILACELAKIDEICTKFDLFGKYKSQKEKYANLDHIFFIALSFIDEIEMQELNFNYKGKQKATNILSFSSYSENNFLNMANYNINNNNKVEYNLGDLLLCPEYIEDEIKKYNINYYDHLIHLILHGTMHLFGYDHETSQEAEEMEGIEENILQKLGITKTIYNS